MKVRFNRWYSALLAVLLSMLGIESCDCNGDGPVEYGTPHADYKFKGVVTDGEGIPVQGIKATLLSQKHTKRTALTDASGKYEIDVETWSLNDEKLVVEDVDGAANGGEFATDTLDLSKAEPVRVKKGSGWYEGAFEVSQNVVLKSKK